MNKLNIDYKLSITLLITVVIAASAVVFMLMGASPVWADDATTDVYEIPEDYQSTNYVVQDRYTSTGKNYVMVDGAKVLADAQSIIDYTYDFTVYYPTDWLSFLRLSLNSYNKFYFYLDFYNQDKSIICGFSFSSNLKFDDNNVAQAYCTYYLDGKYYNLPIYIKKNNCMNHSLIKTTDYGIFEEDNILTLSSLDASLIKDSLLTINYPFYLQGSTTVSGISYYYSLVYSGIYDNSHVIQEFRSNTNDNRDREGAFALISRYIENNKSGVYPEPILNKVNKISDTTLHCYYDYPTQGRTPSFNWVYPKIYVKESGKDWVEVQNVVTTGNSVSEIYKLHVDNQNKLIWGSLSLTQLYVRLGYTFSEIFADDFEPPKIEGIIWGVQYGYPITQNIIDESSIRKSKIVFSRYVFEDNVVDTPDVGIGDLGDLPNISGSSSSIEVGTGDSGTSGGAVRPGGGHYVGESDSVSFIDLITNGKLSFSSVGSALQSVFAMVSGFGSAIGSFFTSAFGEAVGIVVLCSIGVLIVLRVLGR